ncbi:TetR/AcrR family transcriptional regulator [Nocardioides immobilis]|uniref:TetR/AcrR family transcriptional regulator n=1 Tax=Nocardioides immobilis TaxID=2049295 RepID=A0A417Y6J6_9ACTN|nr:TetR/AcrR family transcriptional regulator [Nocardioides immobilis]RHW28114.1 TetR/AcrR family transcriptional regulator [Nocardioides immobilis]
MTTPMTSASPQTPAPPRTRRPRRTTPEVKRLILQSAREAFQRHGYANTRTRDIAAQADVVEKVIFRHFGSKAGLFEAAVVDTVAGFLREHIASWQGYFDQEHTDVRAPTAAFIAGLYDVLHDNRGLLAAYLAAASFDTGTEGEYSRSRDLLGTALQPLDELSRREQPIAGFGPINIVVTIRATFGMLLSLAVYGDLLFPSTGRPSRQEIVDECLALVFDGWDHRSGPPAEDSDD